MSARRQTVPLILEPTHVRWSHVQRSVRTTKCSVNVQDACNRARWRRETLPIADISILLVVIRANFLTVTNLLKMMVPATNWHSCSYFATKDPVAILRRMGVVALLLFSGCKDSPDLVDDGELQMCEMPVGNPLDLSFAVHMVQCSVSAQDCVHTLIALSMLQRVICQQVQQTQSR